MLQAAGGVVGLSTLIVCVITAIFEACLYVLSRLPLRVRCVSQQFSQLPLLVRPAPRY